MDEQQARRLGEYLERQRVRQEMSSRELGRRAGLNYQTILRIEHGDFLTPGPDKLKALATALGLSMTDVWSLAGYRLDAELPSPLPFLRAKFRDLSDVELNALTEDVAHILRVHGIDAHDGPAPGEDEIDDELAGPSPTEQF